MATRSQVLTGPSSLCQRREPVSVLPARRLFSPGQQASQIGPHPYGLIDPITSLGAPSPNAATLGDGASTYEYGGGRGTKHSVHDIAGWQVPARVPPSIQAPPNLELGLCSGNLKSPSVMGSSNLGSDPYSERRMGTLSIPAAPVEPTMPAVRLSRLLPRDLDGTPLWASAVWSEKTGTVTPSASIITGEKRYLRPPSRERYVDTRCFAVACPSASCALASSRTQCQHPVSTVCGFRSVPGTSASQECDWGLGHV